MNNSIQQEIAAPNSCKNLFPLIMTVLVNFLLLAVMFTVLILKQNNVFDGKLLTPPFLIGMTVTIALVAAVLLRRRYDVLMCILALATINSASLFVYHTLCIYKSNSSADLIWRLTTIIISFALLLFTLVFLGIYYYKPREKKNGALSATKYLTYCAMFTALSVICKMIGNAISSVIPFAGGTLKFTIVYLPWVLGGIVLGPIGGFVSAAIGDFVGQLAVSTGGLPIPALTMANGLFAVFPAIAYKIFFLRSTSQRAMLAGVVGIVISTLICTLGISSYTLYLMLLTGSDTFLEYLVTLRLPQTVVIAANIPILIALIPPLVRAKIIRKPLTVFFD